MSDRQESRAKARLSGAEVAPESGAPPVDDRESVRVGVGQASTIEPLISPRHAYFVDNWSAHLGGPRQAYVTATQCHGFRVVPLIDLTRKSATKQVRELMESLRLVQLMEASQEDDPFDGLGDDALVSDDEVEREMLKLRRRQMAETVRVQRFYARVYPEGPLTDLRMVLAQDRWLTGGRWLAVSRDDQGRPARYTWLPSDQMRFTVQSSRPARFRRLVRDGISQLRVLTYQRFPRLIVQMRRGKQVIRYYKEWGDTRLIDAVSGREYRTMSEFNARRTEARRSGERSPQLATEVLFNGILHPATYPYGRPYWWGARLKIENSTRSDQVVGQYYDDPTPRVLLLVAGGNSSDVDAIGASLEERASGVRNHGKILILEGIRQDPATMRDNPTAAGGVPKIDHVDLGTGIPDDFFAESDEANERAIGASTMTPPLIRGRDKDVNRASATEQRRAYEAYLAGPERLNSWDREQNALVLPELGICTVRIESLGPRATTDAEINEEIRQGVESAVLTPNDGRVRYRLGEEPVEALEPSSETPWVLTPPKFAKALSDGVVRIPDDGLAPTADEESVEEHEPEEDQESEDEDE